MRKNFYRGTIWGQKLANQKKKRANSMAIIPQNYHSAITLVPKDSKIRFNAYSGRI